MQQSKGEQTHVHVFTALTPRPEALGNRFSSGTSTSSMRIIPVVEALRENFPSILGVERPFMPCSKIKPRTFPSSHLAQTIAISATGELVILTGKTKGACDQLQTKGCSLSYMCSSSTHSAQKNSNRIHFVPRCWS